MSKEIKFPCCVPTSEIKDAKTLLALVTLFEANGATVYDGVDCAGGHEFDRVDSWDYFGVSLRAGSTFRTDFYDDFEDYNQTGLSSEITLYPVANLLGEEVKTPDNEDWIEWKGGEIPPVAEGTVVDVKFRDWEEDTDVSHVYSWLHSEFEDSDIIAYRIHKPSVASQEAIAERLEDKPSVGIDLAKEGSDKTVVALVSITQEVKYTVVIKDTTFTFTQDELDALTEELLGFTTL